MTDEETLSKVNYLVSTGHCVSRSMAKKIVAQDGFEKVTRNDYGRRPKKNKLIEISPNGGSGIRGGFKIL